MKSGRRPYRQSARAEAAEQTRERILDVVTELFWQRDPDDITLEQIAAESAVTLQTVLRKFGSKEGVFAAALEERADRFMEQRRPAAPGARAAVTALVQSYEQIGDANWRMLRHEAQQPIVRRVLGRARALHRGWIEESFTESLPPAGRERERSIDGLATVLDFYVWKLHRRDLGRTRKETEALMLSLVEAITRSPRSSRSPSGWSPGVTWYACCPILRWKKRRRRRGVTSGLSAARRTTTSATATGIGCAIGRSRTR